MERATKRRILRFLLRTLVAGLVLALPFGLLVRGALVASASWGWHAWVAVGFGALLAALALSALTWWTLRKLSLEPSFRTVATRVGLPLVTVFCCFSLLYLSGSNAKSSAIREAYPHLHPVLRLAVGTVRLLDAGIVVTDIERGPTSYAAMRLPRPTRSFHYRQKDGTVHAIDLRTEGRSALRNRLVQLYFELLGFETVRHFGTADHLHVRLPEA